MAKVMKIIDCDNRATALDVVVVPEGFSLQMYERGASDYQSVIINPNTAMRLAGFLQEFHRETPRELPKAILLTVNPAELFLMHHLMCFGTVAMAAKEKHIMTSMKMVRRGLAMCGTDGVLSLFSRVNKLTMASFPEAEVIHLDKEDL